MGFLNKLEKAYLQKKVRHQEVYAKKRLATNSSRAKEETELAKLRAKSKQLSATGRTSSIKGQKTRKFLKNVGNAFAEAAASSYEAQTKATGRKKKNKSTDDYWNW